MNKIITLLTLLIVSTATCYAQKNDKKQATINRPENKITILPDLTFESLPIIIGSGYEKVAGIPGRIKIKVSFIVKNIGFDTSKPCRVYIQYLYNGFEGGGEHRHAALVSGPVSEYMPLQAIEKGKSVMRNQEFTFTTTPEDVYGKETQLIIRIEGRNRNGDLPQPELSYTNNEAKFITPVILNR